MFLQSSRSSGAHVRSSPFSYDADPRLSPGQPISHQLSSELKDSRDCAAANSMAVILSSLFELTPTSFVLAVLGIYICGVGQISYLIKEKLYLSPALLSVLVGIGASFSTPALRPS